MDKIDEDSGLIEKLIYFKDILDEDDEDEDSESVCRYLDLINSRECRILKSEERLAIQNLIASIERQIKEGDLIFEYAERLRQKGINPLSKEADSEKVSILLESIGSPDPEVLSNFNENLDVARLLIEIGRRKKQEEDKNEKTQG